MNWYCRMNGHIWKRQIRWTITGPRYPYICQRCGTWR